MSVATDVYEMFSTETSDSGVISEVIRPAAILPERAARQVLAALSEQDARRGGVWIAEPSLWQRFDRPWDSEGDVGDSRLIGSIQIAYGTPTRFEITIYRATLTVQGLDLGWSVRSLCDDAIGYGDLTLASCPRADLKAPPKPFHW